MPAPWLVTRPPKQINTSVANAVSNAKRLSHKLSVVRVIVQNRQIHRLKSNRREFCPQRPRLRRFFSVHCPVVARASRPCEPGQPPHGRDARATRGRRRPAPILGARTALSELFRDRLLQLDREISLRVA